MLKQKTKIMNEDFELEEDEDLIEYKVWKADLGQSPMRIDKYISHHFKNTSRNRIQHAIETESVKVNGKPVKSSYKIKPLDEVSVSLASATRESTDVLPENIPLTIVYEDDDVLVINKPQEMVVHPGHNNWNGTLVNALVYHFGNLPTARNGEIRPGLVHRIDKGTSGLLVIAKTEFAMQHLAKQFFDHSTERTYYALVWGEPKEDKFTVNAHIGRAFKDRRLSDVFPDGEYGKEAITHVEVLERLRYVSLVKCNLETGRTHQIRAHMKSVGHTLFGDAMYGGDKILRGNTFTKYKQFVENCISILPRQALHAKTLGFVHPTKNVWMQFDSELPEDFENVIEKWRHYVKYN